MKQGSAILASVAGAALLLASGAATAEKQTLKMANWVPAVHHMTRTIESWNQAVIAASAGNLSVKVDKAPLAKPPGQYDLAKNGVRDLAWIVAGYTPGRYHLYRIAELPFLCPSATICSRALWKWYAKHDFAKREYGDTILLNAFVHGPGVLHTKKKVTGLADLKGVKVRAAGTAVDVCKALGLTVVSMPATQVHEALQRGTVDAVLFPWEAMRGFRLHKLVRHHLEIPGGLYTAAFSVVLNHKSFAGLSDANKDALWKASGYAGSNTYAIGWESGDVASRAEVVTRKEHEISALSPTSLENWRSVVAAVQANWIKRTNDMGLDGEALLADFKSIVSEEAGKK